MDVYVWHCQCGETFDDSSLPEQRSLHILTRHQRTGDGNVPTCQFPIDARGKTCGAQTLRTLNGGPICTVHYDMVKEAG